MLNRVLRMLMIRCQHIVVVIFLISEAKNENAHKESNTKIDPKCPFSKIIEDIFKIHNKTTDKGIFVENNKESHDFIKNITIAELHNPTNKNETNEEVNKIIESINRIKRNLTQDSKDNLNEAAIINLPKNVNQPKLNDSSIIKTEYEKATGHEITEKNSVDNDNSEIKLQSSENRTYVEILTIEPNNTNKFSNNTSMNIIELLKNIMPMFNSTITKEIYNLTIIERDNLKNNSLSTVKNISTIVVTYCDQNNMSKVNSTYSLVEETILKHPVNETLNYESEYFKSRQDNSSEDLTDVFKLKTDFILTEDETDLKGSEENLTAEEKRDIIEAADYGMQKMHELYTVMEPKLYSLGLWLDDSDPARYVAAFNAPAEDANLYAKYGYASLQAAAKLRELTSSSGNTEGLESRQDESLSKVNLLQQSSLLRHCPIRGVPKCPPASKRYRTHDGTCNNFNRPKWGSTMTPVQRFLPPSYSDGIQAPRRSVRGSKLPSAREISSFIHEDKNVETESITHLLMQWGQLVDHDITSSSQTRGFNGSVPRCCRNGGRDFVPKDLMHPECMPIEVPPADPFYGPRGVKCLDFIRSSPAPRDDCSLGWREQLNQVSAYIDGSPLYGSSAQKSDKLRLFRNGMLQYGKVQQRKPVLPQPETKDELCRGGAVSAECFKSGDARVNEHPGLVAAHIIWLRQHNRMAQELAHLNPHWSDEKIYQETRKIIGAMLQHITYNEFLPIVLGSEVMRLFDLEPQKKGFYRNYDTKVNPSPASSFGSAAFRFGHSLVQSSMMRFDRFHRPMQNNVPLHEEPTNPSNIWSIGAVDRLLLGMVNQPIQKRDEFITEELTNHLFQTPKFDFGMDLAAINIQRGRDHGLPGYTAWREPCGLTGLTEFESLLRVMPARTVKRLQALYRHVDDVDLFTGGMSERPVVGGLVGPTFACIIAQQFSNLRNGDRFWYENGGFDSSFTPAQLQQIRHITFAQVICRTLDSVDNIQPFVFLSPENAGNKRISCQSRSLTNFDLSPWVEVDEIFKNDLTQDDNDSKTTKNITKAKDNHTKNNTKPTTTTQIPSTARKHHNIDAFLSKVTKRPPIPLVDFSELETSFSKRNSLGQSNNFTLRDVIKYSTDNNDKITVKIDKLDIKTKNKRYENTDFDGQHTEDTPNLKTRYDQYDDDDDSNIQSVQSVVINNSPHKRPQHHKPQYNRPVITVTENLDKFTYLINYVPRQTQLWRQTTKKPDKDIVKITYQNYDETYRRPNQPYKYQNYNREDENPVEIEFNYRSFLPDKDTMTDKLNTLVRAKESDQSSTKLHNTDSTTDNSHKLLTFGYVGTYNGHNVNDFEINANTDAITNDFDSRTDALNKDFTINDQKRHDLKLDNVKFSTFYSQDTSTKPYDSTLRTRLYDNHFYSDKKADLDKQPITTDMTITENPLASYDYKDDLTKNSYNIQDSIQIEDRSDSIVLNNGNRPKTNGLKNKRPSFAGGAAKTPSISFQVIPSENSPSLWAVYEEDSAISDGFPEQPAFESDPQASREIPRPFKFGLSKLRRPVKH